MGDRVQVCGCPATVVFVIDRDEWPDDQNEESRNWERKENGSGFLLLQDAGARIFLHEADEDLFFVSRASIDAT